MRDWNQFLRLRKYYTYLNEREELYYEDDNQEARNMYLMTCDKYELGEQERWYLAIALDCIKGMNEDDFVYIRSHLRSVDYHFGYAMGIRNKYLWHSKIHTCYEPDGVSGTIMEYIFSIIHTTYDYRNYAVRKLCEDSSFAELLDIYGNKYAEQFEELLQSVIDKSINVENAVSSIRDYVIETEGLEGLADLLSKAMVDAYENVRKPYLKQLKFFYSSCWQDVMSRLSNAPSIYKKILRQIDYVGRSEVFENWNRGENADIQRKNLRLIIANTGLNEESAKDVMYCFQIADGKLMEHVK